VEFWGVPLVFCGNSVLLVNLSVFGGGYQLQVGSAIVERVVV